jgi:hypothetical protein
MKVIYNKNLQKVTWRGEVYKVDGIEVTNFPNTVLYLDEVITNPPTINEQFEYLSSNWVVDEPNLEYRKEFTVNLYTQQELDERDWKHLQYEKRLVIDESVIFSPDYTGFYIFLQLEGFPIEKRLDKTYVWLNIIRPEHQNVVDYLISENLLTIEEKNF